MTWGPAMLIGFLVGWIVGVGMGARSEKAKARRQQWAVAQAIATKIAADAFAGGKPVRLEIVDEQGTILKEFGIDEDTTAH